MPTAVYLPSLIDQALGSPDPGAVNFNTLHKLLHILVSHLGLNDTRVDSGVDLTTTSHQGRRLSHPRSSPGLTGPGPDDKCLTKVISEGGLSGQRGSSGKAGQSESEESLSGRDIVKRLVSEQTIPEIWGQLSTVKKVKANEQGLSTVSVTRHSALIVAPV